MNHNLHPVFRGLTTDEYQELTRHTRIHEKEFSKGALIFQNADLVTETGIVLTGSVHIENTDFWGNTSLLSEVGAGGVFAETYSLSHEPMMVDVVAASDCQILFMDVTFLRDSSLSGYSWHQKMLSNMLSISIHKNLTLSHRIFCTSPKTIRERLLTYLSSQSQKCGSESFEIPFNRQQMADFLNLDRSALSKELGKMRDEGFLTFHKNSFTLLHPALNESH